MRRVLVIFAIFAFLIGCSEKSVEVEREMHPEGWVFQHGEKVNNMGSAESCFSCHSYDEDRGEVPACLSCHLE